MMAFGTDKAGIDRFVASPALMGDLGTSYIGAWVGDLITIGASVSAFACCLACVVGASRLLFALVRDVAPDSSLARTGHNGTPAAAAVVITPLIVVIAVVCAVFFGAEPFDTFLWSGTIGTLILLVAYVLATVGCIKLIFIDRKMAVPQWEVVIPVLALVMLGYTIYRNVLPYPTEGPAQWFPVVAFGWLALVTVVMLALPGVAARLAAGMADLDDSEKERV
jgi:amino acid transporter